MSDATQQATKTTTAALATVQAELEALDGWTIETADDNALAGEALRDVKRRHKKLEAERKKIAGPLLEAKRAVDALFKPPREALEQAERMIKGKIAGYLEAVAERNTAAVEVASTAESLDDASAALATIEHAEAPAGVNVRHTWRAVVIAEDMLDRRFLSPDMSKIKAWAKEHADADGKPLAIPGVRFDREAIVSSREVKQAKIERVEIDVEVKP
jgi:hypothetical protein